MNLVSIGRFSKMTRLSVKALRLYDGNGLLPAAHVDPSSGYRSYDIRQAGRAEMIKILRTVDMPLTDIQAILESSDPAIVRKQLVLHRERLGDRLATQQRALTYLESLIENEEGTMSYEVQAIEVAPQAIAATRIHTSVGQISADIGTGFGHLMQTLGREGITPAGSPLIVYHDVIDDEADGDIEVCVPIDKIIVGDSNVYGRDLDGGTMASTVHQGPYEEIAAAYHALTGWIAEQGYDIAGPPREIYLNDPQRVSPAELLTRLEFPICCDAN